MAAAQPSNLELIALLLVRQSDEEGTPEAFLRRACELLRAKTEAAALSVWIETDDRITRWRAARGAAATVSRDLAAPAGGQALWAQVERACGVVTISTGEGRSRACRTADGGSVVLIPFVIDRRDRGVLVVEHDDVSRCEAAQPHAVEELSELLGVALSHRRARSALAERVKELRCMYRIAQLGAHVESSLAEVLRQIVGLLPPAWQHPERTHARLRYDGLELCSPGFCASAHQLRADIIVRGVAHGAVEVFVAPDERGADIEEEPFLVEEHQLIEGVAREVSSLIERRVAAEEREQLQQQIRHGDRLATIGRLAAGVAHELNEPLGTILGFAQLALKGESLPPQLRADLDRIVTSSLYAREIIRKLMFFARPTPSHRATLDLEEVIDDALVLLRPRCTDSGVRVERARDSDLPAVIGNGAQLQQVLVNLAINAIQSMPDGGTLRVLTVHSEDKWVRVVVEDEGVGISADDLPRVFVPFFTTKDVGEGTGLGLSVVHGIVSAHGGTVEVESKPGRGSRFEVRLPSADVRRAETEIVS